ncbi:MAG: hypothetical protein MSS51_10755, partial [Bacteroidales bacterium]|nr:hypothetical protein [Bacteroidales bacterium]
GIGEALRLPPLFYIFPVRKAHPPNSSQGYADMDENGAKVFDASNDAWGRQTVTLNTNGLHRGYTGHEMHSEFDIINMNGRLNDPVLGRFLSPDNYVQTSESSQSFNRYSYCMNSLPLIKCTV